MEDHLAQAASILWNQLLADRQFYALSFERIKDNTGEQFGFVCHELSWIIQLHSERSKIRSTFQDFTLEEYTFIHFSDRQVLTEFTGVEQVLTEEMKKVLGRPCGE